MMTVLRLLMVSVPLNHNILQLFLRKCAILHTAYIVSYDMSSVLAIPLTDQPVLNAFFNNWYTALPIATLDALLENQPLINEIDPDQSTNFVLSDILTALSAALAFIGAPEVAPEIQATVGTASKALLNGIQQAPGVAKAIWPSGTTDSQAVQLGHLDSDLEQIYQNFTQAINDTLFLLMSDVPSFLAFASSGAFSGQAKLSLPGDANTTAIALRTFVLTTAMTGNK